MPRSRFSLQCEFSHLEPDATLGVFFVLSFDWIGSERSMMASASVGKTFIFKAFISFPHLSLVFALSLCL